MKTLSKILIFLTLLTCTFFSFAQERGKPDFDAFNDVMKAAKKGNKPSMLKIADICVGKFYDSYAVKDYKAADKWYQKILKTKDTLNKYAYFNLFQINLLGGFGLKEKNTAKAKEYLRLYSENFLTLLPRKEAKDVDLKNFFPLYERFGSLSTDEICELARIYHDFKISYAKAIELLDFASTKGSANAKYLKTKYIMEKDFFRTREKKKITPDKEKEAYEELAKQMYDISSQAKLDFVHLSTSVDGKKINIRAQRVEELLLPLLDSLDDEMKFKIYAIIFLVKKGKEQLEIAQKMAHLNVSAEVKSRDEAFAPMMLFKDFSSKSSSVAGLYEFLRTFEEIPSLPPLNTTEFRRNFAGRFEPLTALALVFDKAENRNLIGNEFITVYLDEILKKIEMNIQAQNNPFPLFKLYQNLTENADLKRVYPNLAQKTEARIQSLNLNAEDSVVVFEKLRIDKKTFKNLDEGRYAYLQVMSQFAPKTLKENGKNVVKEVMSKDNLTQLGLFFKTKVIHDIYGRNPKLEQIERMKTAIYQNKWLLPEGEDIFWQYTQDSDNWFAGKVLLPEISYHYEIKNRNGELFADIKSVREGQSNLVYRTKLLLHDFEDREGEITEVKILRAKYEKYKWKSFESNYLSVQYKQNSPYIVAKTSGDMPKNNAAFSDDLLLIKEEPADFSHKTAVRTALRYFILAYHHALGM